MSKFIKWKIQIYKSVKTKRFVANRERNECIKNDKNYKKNENNNELNFHEPIN